MNKLIILAIKFSCWINRLGSLHLSIADYIFAWSNQIRKSTRGNLFLLNHKFDVMSRPSHRLLKVVAPIFGEK